MKVFLGIVLTISLVIAEDAAKKETVKEKEKQNVVFSYSTVTSTKEGGAKLSQLTIGTGSDGKYHYVKIEDGKKKEGIWEGSLPTTPDLNKILQATLPDVSNQFSNPELSSLSSEIDTSIQEYIKKAISTH